MTSPYTILRRSCAAAILTLGFMATAAMPAQATLYEDLGGKEAIERIVGRLLSITTTDPRIAAQFDNINLDWLKNRLVLDFCQLAEGPCQYPGRDMYSAHKGLHLATRDFNALAEDLQIAMEREQIPFWTANRLMALLAPMHRDIVTK